MHEKPNQNIDTATQELTLDTSTREYSIGFLKNQDSEDPLLITIEQLGTLVRAVCMSWWNVVLESLIRSVI